LASAEGVLGEDRAPDDPWICSSPGAWFEPSEFESDIVVMDEPWIDLNRDLVTNLLKLARPSSERLNVMFVEYLDFFRDDTDVTTAIGTAEVVDGELVHGADDTLTLAKVDGCEEWTNSYAAWQVKYHRQTRSDPDNKFRLIFNYSDTDNYDYAEVNLGAGTGRATVLLGRRLGGVESTLATAASAVDLDFDIYYVWRIQETKYSVPGTSTQRQQIRVLQDQDLVLIYDELVGESTPTSGTIGEKSFKARVTVTWKEVFQAPLSSDSLRRIRPTLRIEPRYVETEASLSTQFSSYGGGGRSRYEMLVNGSGGNITADGLYTAGATSGTVDKVKVTDRFGATSTATIEINP